MKRGNRVTWWLSLGLAWALVGAGLPATGWAQTVQSNVSVTDSSDDDDGYSDTILIGLFVVVVGVLVILGIRSDLSWRSDKDAPLQYAVVEEDTLSWELVPAGSAGVSAPNDGWAGVGLRATF